MYARGLRKGAHRRPWAISAHVGPPPAHPSSPTRPLEHETSRHERAPAVGYVAAGHGSSAGSDDCTCIPKVRCAGLLRRWRQPRTLAGGLSKERQQWRGGRTHWIWRRRRSFFWWQQRT